METVVNHTILKIDKTNWRAVKFGDVVVEPKETCKDIVAEGIEHVVGLEHIDTGDLHLRKSATIEENTTFSKKFRKGDVLFGRRRAYLKKAAQADFDGICSGDITVFRVKKELSSALLPFIVNNDKFFDYAVKHSAGGLSPRVKFKDLANYEFLLPPKAEQARLAELLWAMDGVIEKEKIVLERIEKLKKSKLKDVFNKEKCAKRQISTISESLDNRRIPIKSSIRTSGKYPYYGASGIVDYVSDFIFDEEILLISEDGENLISRNLPIAYSVDEKCWVNNHAHVLKVTKASRYLVKEYFNFTDISDFIASGTRPKLNKGVLMEMPIYLPFEENEIKCEKELLAVDSSKLDCSKRIRISQSLQKSLINQIF